MLGFDNVVGWLVGAAGAVLSVIVAFMAGRRDGRRQKELEDAEKKAEAQDRIAEELAQSGGAADPIRDRQWLREFGDRK